MLAFGRFDGGATRHSAQWADACGVLSATCPAGSHIASRRHETNNAGVVIKGELILPIGNTRTTYGPGDWFHAPVPVEHGAEFDVTSAEIDFRFTVPTTTS